MKRLHRWMIVAALALAACAAFAQDPAPTETAPPAPKKKTLLDYYRIGGWAMHPLLLCSVSVVGVSIFVFRSMNRKVLMPPAAVEGTKKAAALGDYVKVAEIAEGEDSLFTTSLASGMRHFDPDDPHASKPRMEEAIAETMGRQEAKHAFWLNFLSLITAVAPMFGLLGTVSGMIGAFDKIGMGGMGKPELLAANIGEAMITTAAGLLVAIPSMFAYFLLRNLLNKLLTEAEDHLTYVVTELVNPTGETEAG